MTLAFCIAHALQHTQTAPPSALSSEAPFWIEASCQEDDEALLMCVHKSNDLASSPLNTHSKQRDQEIYFVAKPQEQMRSKPTRETTPRMVCNLDQQKSGAEFSRGLVNCMR